MGKLSSKNTWWRRVLRTSLVAVRVIARPALTMTVLDRQPGPTELRPGQLIVVLSGDRPQWAYFDCPGHCGNRIQLSLDLLHPPRWKVTADFLGRPTIFPAVHQHRGCCAHFSVRHGGIDWLDASDAGQAVPARGMDAQRRRA